MKYATGSADEVVRCILGEADPDWKKMKGKWDSTKKFRYFSYFTQHKPLAVSIRVEMKTATVGQFRVFFDWDRSKHDEDVNFIKERDQLEVETEESLDYVRRFYDDVVEDYQERGDSDQIISRDVESGRRYDNEGDFEGRGEYTLAELLDKEDDDEFSEAFLNAYDLAEDNIAKEAGDTRWPQVKTNLEEVGFKDVKYEMSEFTAGDGYNHMQVSMISDSATLVAYSKDVDEVYRI